ncbi:MAG: cupin domain-containing protein [Ruminococcaceae bacterium]|nr:cupin domain-containing protein [Oscillospiraceae bacterium]
MVRKKSEAWVKVNTNMRGGHGTVTITNLLNPDSDEYYGKGRLFAEITLPVGASIGEHEHTGEMECFYVLSGKGVFTDNGTDVDVEEGDVCYTPSGSSHSIRNVGKETLRLMALILFK